MVLVIIIFFLLDIILVLIDVEFSWNLFWYKKTYIYSN